MINISNILDLTNYAFVLFFGITAAFYFVGIHLGRFTRNYTQTTKQGLLTTNKG